MSSMLVAHFSIGYGRAHHVGACDRVWSHDVQLQPIPTACTQTGSGFDQWGLHKRVKYTKITNSKYTKIHRNTQITCLLQRYTVLVLLHRAFQHLGAPPEVLSWDARQAYEQRTADKKCNDKHTLNHINLHTQARHTVCSRPHATAC